MDNKVSRTFEKPDAIQRLADAIIAASRLGLIEITVTTTITPAFEHQRMECKYVLDASEPVAPSRALASTRTGR